MARERRPSDSPPLMPPVKPITLTEKHPTLKKVLIGVLILVAVISLGYALTQLLQGESGWNEVSPDYATGMTVSNEVKLQYNMTGMSTAERKRLMTVYSQASQDAFAVFHPSQGFDGKRNLYELNRSGGKTVRVEEALYHALELLESSGSRYLYMAPLYQTYEDLFFCDDETQAARLDPTVSADTARYFSEVLPFVSNAKHIHLELLGNNDVKLVVSDEYLAYANENGITDFLDFYWMKNAFVIDYIADILLTNGFTKGYLYSVDGFNRSLDSSSESYSFNLFHSENDNAYLAAVMEYHCPLSIVTFRSYPLLSSTNTRCFTWSDGRVTTPYISVNDGLCRASVPELTAVSESKGCAEVMLAAAPYFIADSFDADGVRRLSDAGIIGIWWDNGGFVTPESKDIIIKTAQEESH